MEQFIQNLPPWAIKAAAFALGLLVALALFPLFLKLRRKSTEHEPMD